MVRLIPWLVLGALATGCGDDAAGEGGAAGSGGGGGGGGGAGGSAVDITDAVLTSRSANCASYAASYASSVTDVQRNLAFEGVLSIEVGDGHCSFKSNSVPNHDFNGSGARFATAVSAIEATYQVPSDPQQSTTPTDLSLQYDNAIFLNGVKLDLLAAACYGVGNEPLGQEKIGCFDTSLPWRYDPMFENNDFGTDSHNAHTQPDGTYHYHGNPNALFEDNPSLESPVVGFAADGFPIYGPYIENEGTVREVLSGYELRAGTRVSLPDEGAFPGGDYDGTYRDDYAFTGRGDLDECNGMQREGSYGYYITKAYPWVMGCFKGQPDSSFQKAMP